MRLLLVWYRIYMCVCVVDLLVSPPGRICIMDIMSSPRSWRPKTF